METTINFDQLGLNADVLKSLTDLGYEKPTPVQAECIPIVLGEDDLLAQAQTGTGKTGAFALPLLSKIDLNSLDTQALIMAPTRELAIQVAEAFQSYAKHLKGFHVTPIYGGQEYRTQLRALNRGAQVIVGTPGRLMDHLRRGSLKLNKLKMVVLDEADEMLKMGFIDDIEWILEQTPADTRQTTLFSATMSPTIEKIAKRYMKDAKKVNISPSESTVSSIDQSYIVMHKEQKMEILTRFLEVEDVNAAIIFSRTKTGSEELSEKLQARGYAAAALNGDMKQSARKQVLDRIKAGSIDIIVATDVAARGIDVERVSHVINFDIPFDTESYIHRIGRTGRAGRQGTAILFVSPRERRMLKDIERAVGKPIQQVEAPTVKVMADKRGQLLTTKVLGVLEKGKKLGPYFEMVDNILAQKDCDPKAIAAAMIYLQQKDNPLPQFDLEKVKAAPADHGRRKGGRSKGRRSNSSGGGKPFRARSEGHSYKGRSSEGRSEGGRSGYKGKSSDDGSVYRGKSEGGTTYRAKPSEGGSPYKGKSSNGGSSYKGKSSDGRSSFKGKSSEGGSSYKGKPSSGSSYKGKSSDRPFSRKPKSSGGASRPSNRG